jgi:AraC-like DNA-binding protein
MRKNSSEQSAETPLIETLRRLDHWLTRDGTSRVIVAQPSLKKLKQQNLLEHVRVTPRKMKGPRQPIRGRRHYDQLHLKLARWPNDHMDENALPFILCVTSGQADFRIADYVLHCSVGDWIFVPAGIPKQDGSQPHFEGDPTGRQCEILWIYTGMEREEGISCWTCRSMGDDHFQEMSNSYRVDMPFLAQLFNGFCNEIQELNRSEILTHLLRGVLLLLRSEIKANRAMSGNSREVYEYGKSREPIEEAQIYIKRNIYRHLTIPNVAAQVLVSPSTLTRRFRERTGQTFNEFLSAERVKLASNLLRETNLPISLISEKVGLKYGQLRVLIQQKYHCSPGELRSGKME